MPESYPEPKDLNLLSVMPDRSGSTAGAGPLTIARIRHPDEARS